MWITAFLCIVAFILVSWMIWCRKRQFNIFKSMGIDGPTPNLLFGNLHQVKQKRLLDTLRNWTKEYGKVYGYYEGPAPVLVTSDHHILQEVFISKFNQFYGRRMLPVQPEPETGSDKDVTVLISRGHRWKRLRSTISPSFSTAKMKEMLPLLKLCIDETMEILETKCTEGEGFDIHRIMQGLTMDVISTCAFGLKLNFQQNSEDPFLLRCRRLFADFAKMPVVLVCGILFPEFRNLWWNICQKISDYTYNDVDWLFGSLGRVIDQRRSAMQGCSKKELPRDLLQMLLDAEVGSGSSRGASVSHLTMTESDDNNNNVDPSIGEPALTPKFLKGSTISFLKDKLEEVLRNEKSPSAGSGAADQPMWQCSPNAACEKPKKKLSLDEVKATSVVFLIAGYETLSNLLAYVTYEMAINPHLQRKLQEELDSKANEMGESEGFSYETLQSLTYLEMVVHEALRKYPIATLFSGRLCMESTNVCGIDIPKGMTIQPDVHSLHYDPQHWGPTDPNVFDPDRFLPENKANRHPLAYMPFGAGPKNCVGMRFALTECKLTLARMLSKYNVEPTQQTQIPLEIVEGASLTPKDGVTIRLVKRKLV